ncbi:MAG TPA: sporulation protein, partial [Xanthomonadaceae bacterium]|nr:sporulation protein [Xanthomonadaceae bacterium]
MDTPTKQRLVGAAVLIALAVIFLPMLVKGPAPDSGVSDVPLDMPRQPDDVETRELPLVVPQAGEGGVT